MGMTSSSKKLRYSATRDSIYAYLCGTKEHPSAEMIYENLKKGKPELSLGTVYRNLGQLEDLGKVVRVTNVDGKERYDACCENHVHFVCNKCGRVMDVMDADVNMAKSACNISGGMRINSVQIVLHGICSDCSMQTMSNNF